MTTTTSYGTWTTRVAPYSTGPDADVVDYLNGGEADWRERVERSGALAEMQRAYREAINAALPASVSLCGDEFIGPAYPEEGEFDGYPVDEDGNLDLGPIVEEIDLGPIVDFYDPVTLEEIGREEMQSAAKNPAKTASGAMCRAGLRPFAYLPHPESGRPQAIYLRGPVREALAKRPGRKRASDS